MTTALALLTPPTLLVVVTLAYRAGARRRVSGTSEPIGRIVSVDEDGRGIRTVKTFDEHSESAMRLVGALGRQR